MEKEEPMRLNDNRRRGSDHDLRQTIITKENPGSKGLEESMSDDEVEGEIH